MSRHINLKALNSVSYSFITNPTQAWWCLRCPWLLHLLPTLCSWQRHSRPSSTSRPLSWWGEVHLAHYSHSMLASFNPSVGPPHMSMLPHSSTYHSSDPAICCPFLLFRPSRWPCRRRTCPSSRCRSSRRSWKCSRRRRSRGIRSRREGRRRRGCGGVGPSGRPGTTRAHPPLHLPHPHLPGTKHLHLNALPATKSLCQRYFSET